VLIPPSLTTPATAPKELDAQTHDDPSAGIADGAFAHDGQHIPR
jgi:hypothetical protein